MIIDTVTQLTTQLQNHFTKNMCSTNALFRTQVSGSTIWEIYLGAFSEEDDPVFRDPTSSSHNCNNCKNFIRRYGNIVAINSDLEIISLFDIPASSGIYADVLNEVSSFIKAHSQEIVAPFFETYDELVSLPYESCKKTNQVFRLGIAKNHKMYNKAEAELYGGVKEGEVREFNHLFLDLPKQFVNMTGSSIESIVGTINQSKEVLKRGLDEIPIDTLDLVEDLITQGSLLNGEAYKHKVTKFKSLKQEYSKIPENKKDIYVWSIVELNKDIARFRNELIGVFCTELAEGKDINKAWEDWNKRVDPTNYKKAKAPISQRQINEAQKFVEENGYVESFDRRIATIDDIKVEEIKHVNVGDGSIKGVSMFDGVKASTSTSTRHKRANFDNLEEISIDNFMENVLPKATSLELWLESKHTGNLATMTTSNLKESKPLFNWTNNFSWTFKGNLAGKSMIQDAVEKAGGSIEGFLRFSISWNESGKEIVDLDAHCTLPDRRKIYYGEKQSASTGGFLDVDMIRPKSMGVENIVFKSVPLLKGYYEFYVENYDGGSNRGFKAEIELGGEIYTYEHKTPIGYKNTIPVAVVKVKENGEVEIQHLLEPTDSKTKQVDVWGVTTGNFQKVNLVCLSPNHWGDNKTGNKFYFFMVDGCKSDQAVRSFHIENLKSGLLPHRKVLEVLGATNMIEPSNDKRQLAGLGFNATVRDELIVKVSGSFKRMLKIKF